MRSAESLRFWHVHRDETSMRILRHSSVAMFFAGRAFVAVARVGRYPICCPGERMEIGPANEVEALLGSLLGT